MNVKEFRDIKKDSESIRISGFGGQGVLLLGDIIVDAAEKEGNNITWLPSYGPESRGGTSNCHVVVSKNEIGSPVVNEPDVVIAMNLPSMDKFEPLLKPGGLLIYNESMIDRKPSRDDICSMGIHATEIAKDFGNPKAVNMVVLGAYIKCSGYISKDTVLDKIFPEKFSGKKAAFIPVNKSAVEKGMEVAEEKLN